MNNTDRLCLGCMNDNGGEKICPICGYDRTSPSEENALAQGTWIKERYLCGRVFEKNGESITYLGWDNENDNVVYIKEYFPQGCCTRNADKTVNIASGKQYEFNNGIMQFIDISKKLSTLTDLPAVMPVIDTLEMGGTAYSIIKACTGIPLREFLLRNGGSLRWEQAKPLFLPLITTLGGLHKAGILHLGISPETIIVGRDGKLHIFGIAIPEIRRANSGYTSQLFPGFAAAEQYTDEYPIGRHTDVYSLAATLFRVLIGNPPMAANERMQQDNMSIPAKVAQTIPPYVLSALANALQISPKNRTASMAEFKSALTTATGEVPVKVTAAASQKTAPKKPAQKGKSKNASKKYAFVALAITAGILAVVLIIALILLFPPKKETARDDSSMIQSAPSVSSVGDVDPNLSSDPVEKLHEVPSFTKKSYAEVMGEIEYTQLFTFKIKAVECNDTLPEGYIISQSITAGEMVKRDTEIELVISAGSAQIEMPDLVGMSHIDAYVTLLELGFSKDNITFMDKYDDTKNPLCVIETEIPAKTMVSRYAKIIIFMNSYEGTDENLDTYTSSEVTE